MPTSSDQRQAMRAGQPRRGRAVWQYAVAGVVFGLAFPVIATGIRVAQSGGKFGLTSIGRVQASDPLLWIIDTAPLILGLLAMLAGLRQDVATARTVDLARREQELEGIQASLENRVIARTRDIEERSRELRDAVLLTRRLSGVSDTRALLTAAARELARTYSGHRVDFYLLDQQGGIGALVASSAPFGTGEHGFRVGDDTIQGRAASEGQSVAVQGGDAKGIQLALPLMVRGRTLGVLCISEEPSASEPRQPRSGILELLTDQIATIVDSAQLLEQTRSALDQLQVVTGQRTGRAWRDFAAEHHVAYEYTPGRIQSVPQASLGSGPDWMRVPLTVRGQQVGSLAMRRDASLPWTEGERDLARQVAIQAGSALENARLLVEAEERAGRQQKMAELSSRLGATVDVDTLLQIAAQEIASLPGVSQATVILAPEEEPGNVAGEA